MVMRPEAMVRVNVGCWHRLLPGYVNVDFQPQARECPGGEYVVLHDVTQGLPFEDGTIAEVRGDHFLEHLTLPQLRAFLDECARVLCPGGEARFEFPDVALAIGQAQERLMQEQGLAIEGIPDRLVWMQLLTREWGHRTILTLGALVPLFAERFAVRHAATYGPNGLIIGVKE